MAISELFWEATVDEMKRGYIVDAKAEAFVCLVCGRMFEHGVIYPHEGVLYEAERYVRKHIETEHGSMFQYLIGLDKKWTGLTDLQRSLLEWFRAGLQDSEIVKELGGGSKSTVRNHRFTLREKMKQAKVFLSIMELVEEGQSGSPSQQSPVRRTATMLDERYAVTEQENEEIIRTYFPNGIEGPISEFPKKEKRKLVILRQLMRRFEPNRSYTEKEVNAVLEQAFDDYVTIRRYLIEYGFLDRKPDGSAYWVNSKVASETVSNAEEERMRTMDTRNTEKRKQLVADFMDSKRTIGVYQILNQANGKRFVGSSVRLDSILARHRFTLQLGTHSNKVLQQEWKEYGEESFVFEILELLKPEEEETRGRPISRVSKEMLEKLEEKWIADLQPFGERGYNSVKHN
nr:DUF2087 domain-containing protein [Paenibacillus turpanensis]